MDDVEASWCILRYNLFCSLSSSYSEIPSSRRHPLCNCGRD